MIYLLIGVCLGFTVSAILSTSKISDLYTEISNKDVQIEAIDKELRLARESRNVKCEYEDRK